MSTPPLLRRGISRRVALQATATGLATAPLLAAAPVAARQQATPAAAEGGVGPALDLLDGIVSDLMDRTGVPGVAVTVVTPDETLVARGYGVANTESGAAVDADTRFQLASLSKPMASTVVAGIVGEGTVGWDDRIVDHFPDFALADAWPTREVTIRDMFCHRSGLPEHAGDLLEDMGYDRDVVLHRLRYQTPATSLRSAYAYTNFGLTAGAVAAAAAAGETWEDAAAARLYEPAGMTRTSSRFVDFADDPNHAATHVEVDGAWVPKYVRQPDPQSPAGGVSSTATDMAPWMRLQLGGGTLDGVEIVAADALAATHVPHIVSSPPGADIGFYGLGWNVTPTKGDYRISHSGAFALGAGTTVFLLLDQGVGISVLTNGSPIGLAESIALSFIDAVATGGVQHDYLSMLEPVFADLTTPQYGGDVSGDPPSDVTPARALDAYTGIWHNDFIGHIVVAAEGEELSISMGPADDLDVYPMTHWDRDTFTYEPQGENGNIPAAITFAVGPDGTAARMWVENLDIHGEGTFTRDGGSAA